MTHSPAQIIRKFFLDEGLFADADWPAFTHHLPEADATIPVNAAVIRDTSGNKDSRLMTSGEVIEHPGLQILIRSKTFEQGWARAQSIRATVDTTYRAPVIIGSSTYRIQNLSRTTPVIPLGTDTESKQRQELFSLNILATIKDIS